MLRISGIKTCDTENGPGLRVSLWTQGCPFKCDGCHNSETWSFCGGKRFAEHHMKYIIEELKEGQDFSILGGEPLLDVNSEQLEELLLNLKDRFPNLNVWLWTGREWEDALNYDNILKYVDVCICGKYDKNNPVKDSDRNLEKYRYFGSKNQYIVDVKKSLDASKRILLKC